MTTFNLNELIRSTLERSREADPHVIARRLVARIPAEHVHAALADCLADRVRIQIGRSRMQHVGDLLAVDTTTKAAATSRPGRSWRKQTAALFAQRLFVPSAGWKRLGECTAEDCDAVADAHARRAVEQAVLEERFRAYARLLRDAGVATLADLGADKLAVAA